MSCTLRLLFADLVDAKTNLADHAAVTPEVGFREEIETQAEILL
jgi:hypothetical protein